MGIRINSLPAGTPSDNDYFAFDGENGTKKVSKGDLLGDKAFVSYGVEQSLTDEQKALARGNIGALSLDDIKEEYVRAIKVINQSITLGEVNTLLNTINTAEEHVFFDVSALGAKMYLCTISIDTTANTYTIFDLVLGRIASGVYESSKLLTMAIAQESAESVQEAIEDIAALKLLGLYCDIDGYVCQRLEGEDGI